MPLILAAIIVAKNPAQYGFDVAAADADRLREGRGAARDRPAAGRRVDRPDHRRHPGAQPGAAALDDAAGDAELPAQGAGRHGGAFASRLAAASPDELAALKWYTVRRGESLATIARKLSVSRADLAEANQLSIKSRVRVGQELVIPRAPADAAGVGPRRRRAAPRSRRGVARDQRTGDRRARRRREPSATLMYRVKRGDTLSSIARLFDTTVDKIKQLEPPRTAATSRPATGSRSCAAAPPK